MYPNAFFLCVFNSLGLQLIAGPRNHVSMHYSAVALTVSFPLNAGSRQAGRQAGAAKRTSVTSLEW
jgi:hypothetical protein